VNTRLEIGFSRVSAQLEAGFGQVDARLDGLTQLSKRQLEVQQQQLHLQAQHFYAEQQRRERERQLHELYADAADVLHTETLAVRAIERQASEPSTDSIALWARLLLVERRSRALEPARVDPTQRRDLIELRDEVARCAENLRRAFQDQEARVLQWANLEAVAHGLLGAVSAALHQLRAHRDTESDGAPLPQTAEEATKQIHAAEARLSELNAGYPEPMPNAVEVFCQHLVSNEILHGATFDPVGLRRSGVRARRALLSSQSAPRRALLRFRWGTTLGYVWTVGSGALFLVVAALAQVSAGWALLLGAIIATGVPTMGWALAHVTRRSAIAYYEWVAFESARVHKAENEVATLRYSRVVLEDAECFRSAADGGIALGMLNEDRPDLVDQIRTAALWS